MNLNVINIHILFLSILLGNNDFNYLSIFIKTVQISLKLN